MWRQDQIGTYKSGELILGSDSGSRGVKGEAYRVPGGHGLGLQGPRGSRVRPTGSQGVKGEVSGVPKDQQRQHGCVGPPEVVQEVVADSNNNFWVFLDYIS